MLGEKMEMHDDPNEDVPENPQGADKRAPDRNQGFSVDEGAGDGDADAGTGGGAAGDGGGMSQGGGSTGAAGGASTGGGTGN